MALFLKKMYLGYFWIFDDLADPRPHDYFLMSSLLHPVVVVAGYLYFVNKCGPKFMENRKPFELKKILILYNVIQIVVNAVLAGLITLELFNINWDCEPVNYSTSPQGLLHLRLTYYYFLSKLFDLLDTVFFVLRKSYRQITFLHVYHHCGIFGGTWMITKFIAGGSLLWSGLFNTLVHTAMFTYYLLTVIDDKWKHSLKWKKTLTQFQLIQFGLNILIFGRIMVKSDCMFPKFICYLWVPQNLYMIFMFSDFYIKAYVHKKKEK